MSVVFNPTGTLDISTDPADLPEGTMQRCKNLRIDQQGVLKTRDGCTKLNSTAIDTSIYEIIEQGGTRYSFAGTIIYEDESSIKTGLTDAAWSAILYNSYNSTVQNVFALNGTDRKRIEGSNVYEWGIEAPTVAPTLATGALTGLTGDYNAKYTYCRKSGTTVICESDPSPAGAAAVSLSNESLDITWTASSDSQVTHVRIYRTLDDGLLYYHDQDIAIGTVTVDSDTTDASLGAEVDTNHDRPPLGSFVAGPNYNGYCFIIKDNLLYYCLSKRPEYWPVTYFIEVSAPQFPGQCLIFHNGQPYYLTKHKIYFIQGTGYNTFFPLQMESITGAQGPNAACSVHGVGIYHVGSDGLYLYSGNDKNITQAQFRPIFRGETANGIPGAGSLTTSWVIQFQNRLYFGYAGTDDTYPTNVLCFNMDNQRVAYYSFGTGELRSVCVDNENNRLLAGDSNGYIWELEDPDVTTDDGTAISFEAESRVVTMPTRRHFPRWIRYDVDASSATTVTGEVVLDGSTLQSHTITGDRVTKQRLINSGNGKRCSIKISGTGPAEIYTSEME